MSGPFDPAPPPPPPPPPRPPAGHRPPPPPPTLRVAGSPATTAFLTVSLLLNVFFVVAAGLLVLFVVVVASGSGEIPLTEKYHSGDSGASDKIAIIRIEGIILEGTTGFVQKQIDQAGQDSAVKAVVVRIDSPGGSITASDDLYHRLTELRDGNAARKIEAKKHLIVSMGGMAASGGYYVAMPAETLVAERTTVTGSIGVYASLPNVAELADKYGVKMNIIKHGEVKASGSLFKKLTPEDRQLWQESIDSAFDQFLKVV
jgi:protease-4